MAEWFDDLTSFFDDNLPSSNQVNGIVERSNTYRKAFDSIWQIGSVKNAPAQQSGLIGTVEVPQNVGASVIPLDYARLAAQNRAINSENNMKLIYIGLAVVGVVVISKAL